MLEKSGIFKCNKYFFETTVKHMKGCLLYTSDAADE